MAAIVQTSEQKAITHYITGSKPHGVHLYPLRLFLCSGARKGAEAMAGRAGIINLTEVVSELRQIEKESETVVKRTISDISKRAPGWVASEVVQVYGIKKGEITPNGKGKKAGNISTRGNTIASMQLVYRGRVLTPTHFGMTPKSPPAGRGYTLKANILKGNKATLGKVKKLTKKQRAALGLNFTRSGTKSSDHSPIMLMRTGGTYIPFQRKSTNRKDLEAIKTVSVPQMVSNEKTEPGITKTLNENIEKRFHHHLSRMMK